MPQILNGRRLLTYSFFYLFISLYNFSWAQPEYDAAARLIPNQLDEASVKLDALYEKAVKSSNDTLEAKVLYLKGIVQNYRGHYYVAADYFERVLSFEDYLNQNLLAKEGILNNLGICYEYIEDLDRAFEAYVASLDVAIERGDSSGIVQSWINLGLLATNQGNLDVGEQYLRMAEAYCAGKPEERYNLALVHNNLAHLLEKQGDKHAEMLDYLARASLFFQEAGDTLNWVLVLANQTAAYCNDYVDPAKATTYFKQLQQVAARTQLNPWLEALITRIAGDYWFIQGQYEQAYTALEKARSSYITQLNILELRRTYRRMLEVRAAQGNYEAYARLDKQADKDINLTEQLRSKARYEELAILYEVKEKEDAISALDNQVKALDQSLTKAIRITQIQGFLLVFLLLLLLSIGLLIGFARQYRDLQWLQNILFKRSQELDALKQEIAKPMMATGELTSTPDDEDQQVRDLFVTLDEHMKQEKWYLDAQIDLKDLSQRLNTNVAYVSKAINTHSGYNFSQYLNNFRIQAVKIAMEQAITAGQSPAITALALQSGFNSYNTFHRVFRAETGLTPSQYLKLLAQKSS